MIKQRATVDYSDLPPSIQDAMNLVREWGNPSYVEFDVISDENTKEWLSRCDDEYTRAHCDISDYFKAQGVPVGGNTILVLRSW